MDYAEGVWLSAESVTSTVAIYEPLHIKSIHLWKQNKMPLQSSEIYAQCFAAMITSLIQVVKKWLHF